MNWYDRSNPGDITPKPWLAPDVITRLESLLKPDMDVLEHGSGGSTLWFASRVKSVTSYESDPDWYREVVAVKPDNVDVVLFQGKELPEISKKYDLILIDGEPVEDRAMWIAHAFGAIKWGGIIVLDNYNRPEYETEAGILKQWAKNVETFHGDFGKYLNTAFYFMEVE